MGAFFMRLSLDSPSSNQIRGALKKPWLRQGFLVGRDGEIRTHDPLHPMQVRYLAALHPEMFVDKSTQVNYAWERVSL